MKKYKFYLFCDECGTKMKRYGVRLDIYPPQYPHKCPKCGAVQKALKSYPDTVYKPV